jgi:DNA-directed RNA polymerase specialized sigma24 family protein
MEVPEPRERFIRLLTEHQNSLFAYLVSLVGDLHEASNILPETNMVLWRKADEFEQATNFLALARKVACVQTLAFLRDRKRDRHRQAVSRQEMIARLPLRIEAAEIGNWVVPRETGAEPIRNFNGRIDEFLLFRAALEPHEIRQMYEAGRMDDLR